MDWEKCGEKFYLWESLKSCISNNIDYLKCEESNSLKLHGALLAIFHQIDEAKKLYEDIESFCHEYDLDENLQANGYRSFLKIFDAAINHVLKTLKNFTENRSRLLFRTKNYVKDIEACNQLLASLISSFIQLISMHSVSESGNLFPTKKYTTSEVLDQSSEINQNAFYGRCLGFQYYDSIRNILKFISISMASYSESYYSNKGRIMKTSNSIYNSGRYFFDPEMLANRIVDLSHSANIDFCKNFWCLSEMEVIHSMPFVNYSVKVNRLIKLNPNPLTVSKQNNDGYIEVQSPGIITCRLISAQKRSEMIGESDCKSTLGKCKELLIHCHGGGFVAQSSKSHLVYLQEWAVNLNIPILSIDYSLAPEKPYPCAANEVFYTYCWILKNCELLGSTGEKIVFCGDSAGANLCMSTVIRSINLGIRRPSGIFIAYCPLLVSIQPSPSRLLCLQDPLIPFGFMIRCLKAYVENSNQQMNDLSKNPNNSNKNEDDMDERNLLCSDNEQELSMSSNKTDSFEEVSCFECHQTDSDIKAHISHVSTASNDTLAGTSFLTEKCKDTLETDSPIDSIRSTISLEKDSFIADDKMDVENFNNTTQTHLIPSTSESCNMQYVEEFIEKYALDVNFKDSSARKTSRTRSEENIIFDVSKESLCVRNLQRKFQYAASSIAKTFSTTIEEITKNNHEIINNFEMDSIPAKIPKEDFDFEVPRDPLISPYYAGDDILEQFPPIRILSLTLDSCLDDSIMFAKRLKALNVDYKLDVLDKLPHGFLNFARLSKEAHEGSKLSMRRIAELFDLNLDTAKSFC